MYRDCLIHPLYLFLLRREGALTTIPLDRYRAHKIHLDSLPQPKGSLGVISRRRELGTCQKNWYGNEIKFLLKDRAVGLFLTQGHCSWLDGFALTQEHLTCTPFEDQCDLGGLGC